MKTQQKIEVKDLSGKDVRIGQMNVIGLQLNLFSANECTLIGPSRKRKVIGNPSAIFNAVNQK